jgi:hypothetical protein
MTDSTAPFGPNPGDNATVDESTNGGLHEPEKDLIEEINTARVAFLAYAMDVDAQVPLHVLCDGFKAHHAQQVRKMVVEFLGGVPSERELQLARFAHLVRRVESRYPDGAKGFVAEAARMTGGGVHYPIGIGYLEGVLGISHTEPKDAGQK